MAAGRRVAALAALALLLLACSARAQELVFSPVSPLCSGGGGIWSLREDSPVCNASGLMDMMATGTFHLKASASVLFPSNYWQIGLFGVQPGTDFGFSLGIYNGTVSLQLTYPISPSTKCELNFDCGNTRVPLTVNDFSCSSGGTATVQSYCNNAIDGSWDEFNGVAGLLQMARIGAYPPPKLNISWFSVNGDALVSYVSFSPSNVPSVAPTRVPTGAPTLRPVAAPTVLPTEEPTAQPTSLPTLAPTPNPPESASAALTRLSGPIAGVGVAVLIAAVVVSVLGTRRWCRKEAPSAAVASEGSEGSRIDLVRAPPVAAAAESSA